MQEEQKQSKQLLEEKESVLEELVNQKNHTSAITSSVSRKEEAYKDEILKLQESVASLQDERNQLQELLSRERQAKAKLTQQLEDVQDEASVTNLRLKAMEGALHGTQRQAEDNTRLSGTMTMVNQELERSARALQSSNMTLTESVHTLQQRLQSQSAALEAMTALKTQAEEDVATANTVVKVLEQERSSLQDRLQQMAAARDSMLQDMQQRLDALSVAKQQVQAELHEKNQTLIEVRNELLAVGSHEIVMTKTVSDLRVTLVQRDEDLRRAQQRITLLEHGTAEAERRERLAVADAARLKFALESAAVAEAEHRLQLTAALSPKPVEGKGNWQAAPSPGSPSQQTRTVGVQTVNVPGNLSGEERVPAALLGDLACPEPVSLHTTIAQADVARPEPVSLHTAIAQALADSLKGAVPCTSLEVDFVSAVGVLVPDEDAETPPPTPDNGETPRDANEASSETADTTADQVQHSAVKIQALYRGGKARARVGALRQQVSETQEQQMAAVKIQSLYRGGKARRRVKGRKATQAQAATKIQSRYRGARDRAQVGALQQARTAALAARQAEETAAVRIQARYRGGRDRDEVRVMLKAREEAEELLEEQTEACVKIQAVYRGGRERTILRSRFAPPAADANAVVSPALAAPGEDCGPPSPPALPATVTTHVAHAISVTALETILNNVVSNMEIWVGSLFAPVCAEMTDEEAVVKIQSLYRGGRDRDRVRALLADRYVPLQHAAWDTLDNVHDHEQPRHTVGDSLDDLSAGVAAVKIQSVFRGGRDRAAVKAMHQQRREQAQAALKIQSRYRGGRDRTNAVELKRSLQVQQQDHAAVRIQARYRGGRDRAMVRTQLQQRAQAEGQPQEAQHQQQHARQPSPHQDHQAHQDQDHEAAAKIQARYRGGRDRAAVRQRRQAASEVRARTEAAVKIQARQRGRSARARRRQLLARQEGADDYDREVYCGDADAQGDGDVETDNYGVSTDGEYMGEDKGELRMVRVRLHTGGAEAQLDSLTASIVAEMRRRGMSHASTTYDFDNDQAIVMLFNFVCLPALDGLYIAGEIAPSAPQDPRSPPPPRPITPTPPTPASHGPAAASPGRVRPATAPRRAPHLEARADDDAHSVGVAEQADAVSEARSAAASESVSEAAQAAAAPPLVARGGSAPAVAALEESLRLANAECSRLEAVLVRVQERTQEQVDQAHAHRAAAEQRLAVETQQLQALVAQERKLLEQERSLAKVEHERLRQETTQALTLAIAEKEKTELWLRQEEEKSKDLEAQLQARQAELDLVRARQQIHVNSLLGQQRALRQLRQELDSVKDSTRSVFGESAKMLKNSWAQVHAYVSFLNPVAKPHTATTQVETVELPEMSSATRQIEYAQQITLQNRALMIENRKLHNEVQDIKSPVRVFGRLRPMVEADAARFPCVLSIRDQRTLSILKAPTGPVHDFKLERVFPTVATQQDVYEEVAPLIAPVLDGRSVTVVGYGASNTGKTYTLFGAPPAPPAYGETLAPGKPDAGPATAASPKAADLRPDGGLAVRAVADLFKLAAERSEVQTFEVGVQVFELHAELLRDLLPPTSHLAKPHDFVHPELFTSPHGAYVSNASEALVRNASAVAQLLDRALLLRTPRAGYHPREAHLILQIRVAVTQRDTQVTHTGRLRFLVVAGSENLTKPGTGPKEAATLNKSLMAFQDVMIALADDKPHIPYRNSKLTHLLMDSIGGTAKTLLYLTVSCHPHKTQQTLRTLAFGRRCSQIVLHGHGKKLAKPSLLPHLPGAKSLSGSQFIFDLHQQLRTLKAELACWDMVERELQRCVIQIGGRVSAKSRTNIRLDEFGEPVVITRVERMEDTLRDLRAALSLPEESIGGDKTLRCSSLSDDRSLKGMAAIKDELNHVQHSLGTELDGLTTRFAVYEQQRRKKMTRGAGTVLAPSSKKPALGSGREASPTRPATSMSSYIRATPPAQPPSTSAPATLARRGESPQNSADASSAPQSARLSAGRGPLAGRVRARTDPPPNRHVAFGSEADVAQVPRFSPTDSLPCDTQAQPIGAGWKADSLSSDYYVRQPYPAITDTGLSDTSSLQRDGDELHDDDYLDHDNDFDNDLDNDLDHLPSRQSARKAQGQAQPQFAPSPPSTAPRPARPATAPNRRPMSARGPRAQLTRPESSMHAARR